VDDAAVGTLLVGAGTVPVGGVDRAHRAVLVVGDTIAWTGVDPRDAPGRGHEVVDLGGAWLAPGFVDAHVHGTATGLALDGLQLATAGSAAEVVAAVARRAAERPADRVVHGGGWDDLGWPEGRPPTAEELSAAAPGRTVVLTRVDGHSCLVDAATLAALDLRSAAPGHVHRDDDGRPTGWLLESASALGLAALRAALSPADLDRARQACAASALDLGITAVHEMGVPALSSLEDALAWATADLPVDVTAYWADLAARPDEAGDPDDPRGRLRPGGDLFLDGSIGSCTAACTTPYRTNDGGTTTGELFADDAAVTDLFAAATRAGVGAGVHAIGDRAVGQALACLRAVADRLGVDAVRRARHRIEHVEVVTAAQIAEMAALDVTASVQPAFDAVWNGPGGLYEHRFGRAAADRTNPFAAFAAAGVALCLSSDSTVTPLDPWGGVLAAERHHGGLSLDRATALHAATLGGHRAVGAERRVGALTPGRRADVVAWPGDPLAEDPLAGGAPWRPVAVLVRGTRHR
jgi:predicted amidohydrolase YtcJ